MWQNNCVIRVQKEEMVWKQKQNIVLAKFFLNIIKSQNQKSSMPTLIQYIPNTISFLPPPPLLPILPTPQLISVSPISPASDPFLLCFPSEKSDPPSNINNIWHSRMQKNLPYIIVSGLDRESYPVEGNRFH